MKKQDTSSTTQEIIQQLIALLTKANAHATFNDAIKNIPFEDLGKKPNNLPYSIWQITEHIRIAQKDILEFSTNKNYKELDWPNDYWPKEAAPKNEASWKKCIDEIQKDLDAFIQLLNDENADLYTPFEHGNGQNLLREALLIADHTSYHTGEIIVIRRVLGNWKS
ncbi:MAG TPA: DinB family protein [Parafilimonas sp.]|nr:DinB family protein [Parafilimonas sp.]